MVAFIVDRGLYCSQSLKTDGTPAKASTTRLRVNTKIMQCLYSQNCRYLPLKYRQRRGRHCKQLIPDCTHGINYMNALGSNTMLDKLHNIKIHRSCSPCSQEPCHPSQGSGKFIEDLGVLLFSKKKAPIQLPSTPIFFSIITNSCQQGLELTLNSSIRIFSNLNLLSNTIFL